MESYRYFDDVGARAAFRPDGMLKLDCFRSAQLFVGLNCLAPGQSQRTHTHADSDKFYLVVRGRASFEVGGEIRECGAGALAWAPAGVPHGIREALEPTVVLVAMAPPPQS